MATVTSKSTTIDVLQASLERLGLKDPLEFVLPTPTNHSSTDGLRNRSSRSKTKSDHEGRKERESDRKRESDGERESDHEREREDSTKIDHLIDDYTAQLLTLVTEYEDLANGSFRSKFIDGFSDLSRAGFNSTRTFGPESYDMRPNQACKVIDITEEQAFELVDRLKGALPTKTNGQTRSEESGKGVRSRKAHKVEKEPNGLEKVIENLDLDTDKLSSTNTPTSTSTRTSTTGSSNTGSSTTDSSKTGSKTRSSTSTGVSSSTISSVTDISETKASIRDPISQFGGLVPYQLRQSQAHFLQALNHAVKLVELQQSISKLLQKLEQSTS